MQELITLKHAKLRVYRFHNKKHVLTVRKILAGITGIIPGGKKFYLSASATVEASLVIPLYMYAVIAVIYVMQILNVRSDVDRAVYNALRSMSKYAYINEDSDKSYSQQEIYFMIISELGTEYAKSHNIAGGNAGIVISDISSDECSSKIEFTLKYAVKNPFNIFGAGVFTINQQFSAEAWLGQEYAQEWQRDNLSEDKVYVTSEGTVYHRDRSCRTINIIIDKADISDLEQLRNSSGGKYYLCERCKGFKTNGDKLMKNEIYITDYGDRYHFNINCSALKRTVFEIPYSAVGQREACKVCSR